MFIVVLKKTQTEQVEEQTILSSETDLIGVICKLAWRQPKSYIFFPGLFFLIFSYFGSFMVVWGFGVGVLFWVFGVGAFC